ncbi:FAS1-like dehydratase domain-containing protein [Janibacter melonis]|uniref:FAS1-like dehydratase domain-containing protein n=1 Tax=Janibacter melonis TaxID=262209 RepID=UPI0020947162|nr:hypothetical protein [Janibacter melonis]
MSTAQAESQERTGLADGSQVEALAALLDLDASSLPVRAVPELWHWTHLLDRPAQRDIGPDGHALRGGLLAPPGPDRKRMFAGGRVRTHALLRPDVEATRRSAVVSRTTKEGRSGRLTFVTVRHDYTQAGRLVVSEDADVVYRDATSRMDIPWALRTDRYRRSTVRTCASSSTRRRSSASARSPTTRTGSTTTTAGPRTRATGAGDPRPVAGAARRGAAAPRGPGLIGHELSYRLVRPAVGPQTLTAVPTRGHQPGRPGARRLRRGDRRGRARPLPTTTTQEDAWQR